MHVGILGGTGPAGRGLASRLAAAGLSVTIGSRDAERGAAAAAQLVARWPERSLEVKGGDNGAAAEAPLVVVGTPWEGVTATLKPLAGAMAGKVVVSMVNALVREGREMLPLIPPRGSMAAAVQAALPESRVAAAMHHLPAGEMEDLDAGLMADVLVCSDHGEATQATMDVIDAIEGLRALDAGSLAQAAAIEAFTAVCVTLNMRYKTHSTLRLGGI
jgi:8-hydroxy-5-deazaflavin:NADPH oxidoreductase